MQKEIDFNQEMASEHRLQEYSKGPVPLFSFKSCINFLTKHNEYLNFTTEICKKNAVENL